MQNYADASFPVVEAIIARAFAAWAAPGKADPIPNGGEIRW